LRCCRHLEVASTLTEGSWLAEICFSLLENLVKLSNLSSLPTTPAVSQREFAVKLNLFHPPILFPVSDIVSLSVTLLLFQVSTARHAALRGVIRNAIDFPVAAHFLKLGPFATHPHGHFGMLGAISSSISLYEMWPTIVVGVAKK
jgi:hypothetical protein